MNTDMTSEPSPASPPAPDTTRRTMLYLLLAAAVLQIPFSAALAPGNAQSGTEMADAAANAAAMVLLAYVMIRLGFRAARRTGFGTLMIVLDENLAAF